jgi:photosystem II stability/assembly factor-like uncharacterized protein
MPSARTGPALVRCLALGLAIMLSGCAIAPPPEEDFDAAYPRPTFAKNAIRFRWQTLVDDKGVVAAGAVSRALAKARGPQAKLAGISPLQWTSVGPSNFPCWIYTISIDPRDPRSILVAGVSGGVWSTSDGGATWAANPDDSLAHTSIGWLIRDPANPDVLYATTLNYFFPGRGILRSADAGRTWQALPATAARYSFPDAMWLWLNVNGATLNGANVLLAATDDGIWRSVDAGTSWVRVSTKPAKDIQFDPNNPQRVLAGGDVGNAFTSNDAGLTWTGVKIGAASGRAILAWARNTPGLVYASTEDGGGSVYRSSDGGVSWSFAGNSQHGPDFTHNAIWVDPGNANNLLVGGVDLFRSLNGGASWLRVSDWTRFPASVHGDQHHIVSAVDFDTATKRKVFTANDGGLSFAPDYLTAAASGAGWTWLPHPRSTMFYGGTGLRKNGAMLIAGGTQDHGTVLYQGALDQSWKLVVTGDGGPVAFDPLDTSILYSTFTFLGIQRSTGSGASWTYICQGLLDANSTYCGGTGKTNFIAPFIQDSARRLIAGGNSLWVTDNPGAVSPAWRAIKPPSTGLYFGEAKNYISAVAVAPNDPAKIWVGHNNGEVYFTNNGTAANPTWTFASLSPQRMVRRILVDADNPSIVYVAYGGFAAGNLWRTSNAGASWQDLSARLPEAPIHSIVRHPVRASALYAGTEVGIFASEDGGVTWSAASDGPGAYSVQELFWIDAVTLGAATLGRGMWTATVPDPGPGARLFNISTRMQVLTGNDVMIAGFVIGGSTPKTVVVNAAGPSLNQYGLNGLANPALSLVRSSDQSVLKTNDNWQTQGIPADAAAIQASGFQPNNALEPALIATLAPGAYTAIVSGVGNTTGVGLVGLFEVDHPEVPLVNISTRGQVLAGNDVMIAGFIVQGTGSQTVVINVAGPSLNQYGLNGLANPTLTLVRSSDQAVLATNDDWQAQSTPSNVTAIQATGFQPNHAAEPAIIATLPPGAYTAVVSGVGGTTGVGLVGVFAVGQ